MTAPRRRWFRLAFSLRTLFVVVTIAAIAGGWVMYQVSWIRQRRTMLDEVRAMQERPAVSEIWGVWLLSRLSREYVAPNAPWSLRIFGEQGIDLLVVENQSEEWMARARRRFPEAKIVDVGHAAGHDPPATQADRP